MRTKIYIILAMCFGLFKTFAQGENDNWYFGKKAAINFSNAANPTALNNSQMSTDEACGTVSDANGNLLFYCSPKNIWNRQHQIMQNGDGLSGGSSAQQLAIVKNPANPNQYFVFTTAQGHDNISITNRISYSIVDMSLGQLVGGSPLGAVLQNFKNIPVTDNLGNNFGSEAITVVAGASINTYWVLIPNGNSLFSYKLDTLGFSNGAPVISNLNFPVSLGPDKYYGIKASPKLNNQNFSNYICISHWSDNSNGSSIPQSINRVVSFDSTTGSINNNYSLNVSGIRVYQPEFNSDGSVLFLANTSIFAIDLQNSTTANVNSIQIFNGPAQPWHHPASTTTLQRNKYGNIYINNRANSFLGMINNPNVYGSNMSVTPNSINLGSGETMSGLPQLITINEPTPIVYYPCMDSLTLTSEPNLVFNYLIGNKITTKINYVLGDDHNITMQAGGSVNLLPGTHINLGARYHAFISRCTKGDAVAKISKLNNNQTGMVLKLDLEERKTLDNQIDIYPNPASTVVNINSGNEKITWELYDLSGKNILKGNSNQVNVQSLPRASYLLKINIDNKIITKKVIVK